MIKRKSTVETKEKFRIPHKKRVKVDMATLPDAVVDGKLTVPLEGKVYFERTLSGVTKVHEGRVTHVYENGTVEIFDETVEQFYSFSLHQKLPNIKAAT
jgi:hypothetical protein